MTEDTLATLLILSSAVIHAVVNAFVKSADDKFARRGTMLIVSGCIAFPALFFVPLPTPEVWVLLALSRFVHLAYEFCLINAYRYGDLSQVYPVFRGTAPVLTALGAFLFLAEVISVFQIAALLILCLGILTFAAERKATLVSIGANRKALMFALATSVGIASYTLIDASGVRLVEQPLTYIAWTYVLAGICFPATIAVFRPGTLLAHFGSHPQTIVLGGVLQFATYGLALLAFRVGQTAEIAALRETSVVFAALIGVIFLGERFGRRRILAAIVIAASAVALKVA